MPFISQHEIITKRIDYVRTDQGWRATFRGPFVATASAADLESCRRQILSAVDDRIVAWLSGTPERTSARRTGNKTRRASS